MSGSRRDNVGKDLIFLGGLVVVAVALILYLVMDADTDVAGPTAGAAPTSISASPDERAAESGVAPVERRQQPAPRAVRHRPTRSQPSRDFR